MRNTVENGEPTFKQYELSGWNSKAKFYHDIAGEITREAVQFLMAAAEIAPGCRLLDVACGPGYGAGYATQWGAHAVGVDLAPGMVTEASKNFPDTEFREGDAEELPFEDATFDTVTCAFGLMHFTDPERAIAEAFRVLKPGGRYVFAVWSAPDKHDFFGLVTRAIETYGALEVSLPSAPSFFRFSEHRECIRVLAAAGFRSIRVEELALQWQPESPADLLAFLEKSSVRMAMVLEKQTPEALAKIQQYILESGQQYKRGACYRLNWPAVMAVASKPD